VGFFLKKKSGGWVLGYRVEHFYFIFIVKKFVKVSVLSLLSLGELDPSLVRNKIKSYMIFKTYQNKLN
jgi:hypothetical protein